MLNDLRYGFRQLLRSPGYALAIVITLGLGIGVNTAVFSMVDGFLLRRLPYPHPARIAALLTHVEGTGSRGHWSEEDDSHVTSDWFAVHSNVSAAVTAAYQQTISAATSGVNMRASADSG